MAVHDGKADYDLNYDKVDARRKPFTTTGGWLGFTDKYWLTALIPDQASSFAGQFTAPAGNGYRGRLRARQDVARAGQGADPDQPLLRRREGSAAARRIYRTSRASRMFD